MYAKRTPSITNFGIQKCKTTYYSNRHKKCIEADLCPHNIDFRAKLHNIAIDIKYASRQKWSLITSILEQNYII